MVSLVVTIIVLLILASIGIMAVTGDNGILSSSIKAKNELEQSSKNITEDEGNYIKDINQGYSGTEAGKNVFLIEYDNNGGEGGPKKQNAATDGDSVNITITETEPTKEDSTFLGWSENKDSTTPEYEPGKSYEISENKILYAVWIANKGIVTINPNGGTWRNSKEEYQVNGNKNQKLILDNPIPPTGYTVTFNGNGTTSPDAQISNKYFSSWKLVGAGSVDGSTYIFGIGKGTLTANYENDSIILPSISRTGYTFLGWYDAQTGGNKIGNGGEKYIPNSNISVYAQWKINTYTIKFAGNGSTSGSTAQMSMTYDVAKALTANGFAKTGYSFNGWNTKADGSGTSYTNGQSVKNLTSTNGGTVTLYAKWQINQYTLTVKPNNGTWNNTTSNSTFTQNYNSTKTIANPTAPSGYKVTFNGNGGSTPSAITSTKSFTSWSKSGSGTLSGTTFTFGAGNTTLTANYNNDSITLPTPTKTGYTFSGWYDKASGGTKIGNGGGSYTPSKDITLYAHWTINKYTLRLNAGSGTVVGSTNTYYDVSCTYNTTYDLSDYYSKFSKSNYVLIGWSTTRNGTISRNIDSNILNLSSTNGAVVNLYARYVTIKTRTWYTGLDGVSAENSSALLDQQSGVGGSVKLLRNFSMQIIPDGSYSLGKTSSINYKGHYSKEGWQSSISDGATYGDVASKYYLQAIQANISGYLSTYYDLYYCVHVRNVELLGWASAGQEAGTHNYNKSTEAIRVKLVRKGNSAPTKVGNVPYSSFFAASNTNHVLQGSNATPTGNTLSDDFRSQYCEYGFTGKSQPLKGLVLSLRHNNSGESEFIQYRGHFAKTGWTNYVSGSTVLSSSNNDLQAVSIRLTGEDANYYDVYYSAHVSHIGWMAWAKNGENAGTQGYGSDYPMEALRVIIVKKGVQLPNIGITNEYPSAFLQK